MNTLFELFDNISNKLEDNKLETLIPIIKEYSGQDWKKYVSFSDDKYKRNLVKRNDKIEMLIICWNKNQCSPIHDHPTNGCILKVLDGKIEEHEYIKKDKLQLNNINICEKDSIGYQEGSFGLHKIVNGNICSVSLHIYAPPNYKLTLY
jgi:cysteine dioxygenase